MAPDGANSTNDAKLSAAITLPEGELTKGELVKRLALRSTALVNDLYQIALRQLDTEERRDALLTTKAGGLLGHVGISATIGASVVGILSHQSGLMPKALAIGFAVVLLFGAVAAILAIKVLLVRGDYQGLNEEVVFKPEVLLEADGVVDTGHEGSPASPADALRAPPETEPTIYRRWLIAHIWGICQHHGRILEGKATTLRRAQQNFAAFIIGLVGLVVVLLLTRAFQGPQ